MASSGRLLLVIISLLLLTVENYRLNVPRVLLPYHPTTQVKFELTVSDPDGGCFTWRSTRSDIVMVKAIDSRRPNDCSSRATIVVTSKHAEEQTSVIFAEDEAAGVTLSCGITVDVIDRISISTTTKVLFLDASPAKMSVQAFNAEGDMFSTLGDIPFEWHLEVASAGERPLRIVPFSQSKYEAPDGVRILEENKKRGYVILVEGVSTGAAILKAGLSDPHYKRVEPQKIDLIVVANLLLVPSQDLYIPLGAVVQYHAEIVKQSATEAITLPSKQYHLAVKNTDICSLEVPTSRVTAKHFGATEISLIDENVKAMSILKPPSAHIYVVEPSGLFFSISGGSWFLEKGRTYVLSVLVTDSDDNIMFIPKNANFDTSIQEKYFEVLWKSSNNTYHHVKATESGIVKITSHFHSILSEDGEERRISTVVRCEQIVTISKPIEVSPSMVFFPYIDTKTTHSWQLKANGGTGSFVWSSEDSNVASVDSTGLVTSRQPGCTEVIATDVRNNAHQGKTTVAVVAATSVGFGISPVEVEIGHEIILNLKLHGEWQGETVAITDCSNIKFEIAIKDAQILREIDASEMDNNKSNKDGCKSIKFKAFKIGDTIVNASYRNSSASIYISVYPPLKLMTPSEVILLLGSHFLLTTDGGPRPWLLDPSRFFTKLEYSTATNLISDKIDGNGHIISCKKSKGDLTVKVMVGNEPTASNPFPATSVTQIRICCGVPSQLNLFISRPFDIQNSCPITSAAIHKDDTSQLLLKAHGNCESGPSTHAKRQFHSLNSLVINWKINDTNLLKIDTTNDAFLSNAYSADIRPKHKIGVVQISAEAKSYKLDNNNYYSLDRTLSSSLKLHLVGLARANPSEILMLSEKRSSKTVKIEGGSGYFDVSPRDSAIIHVTIHKNIAEMQPLRVGKTVLEFIDLCIGTKFFATVSVNDIEEILIEAPEFIVVDSDHVISLKVRSNDGLYFLNNDIPIVNTQLNSSSSAIALRKIDGLSYVMHGESVGVITLIATILTTNGRILQSQPHIVQVFAPMHFSPHLLTLVPNSAFQLELTGGPQPLPSINYHLNDSSIATISQDGMIGTKKIGTALIVGSLILNHNTTIEDSVLLSVISLSAIHISISTSRIQVGEKAWARIEGLNGNETPFVFGGALDPIKVTWSVTTPGVLEMMAPFHEIMAESSVNQFQIELKALRAGETTLRATVILPDNQKKFLKQEKVHEYHISVTVIDPLELLSPARQPRPIIMTANSHLNLQSNRKQNKIRFTVPSNMKKYLEISGGKSPVLFTKTHGSAAFSMMQVDDPFNETSVIPVSILPVSSLHIEPKLPPISGDLVQFLPLGYRLHLSVSFRDHIGRLFSVASNSLSYRPHRFDLTDIRSSNDNRSFEIELKKTGETILMIWDSSDPELNFFLRLPVGQVILPDLESIIESAVVCFKSPLVSAKWAEIGIRHHFNFIDEIEGVAVAQDAGSTTIVSYDRDNQTTFKQIVILPAHTLSFNTLPSFVSDIVGQQFLLPVSVIDDSDKTSAENSHGCEPSELESLDALSAPFDCMIAFDKKVSTLAASLMQSRAIFDPKTGVYACLLEEHHFDGSLSLMEERDMSLSVTASWNRGGKVREANAKIPFYPRFHIIQREIRFNNIDTVENVLVIHVPPIFASKLTIETCAGNVLQITEGKALADAIRQYHIKLNIKSAILWRELLDKCNITVKNSFTGQVEMIPVTIVLHGDAYKLLVHASTGILTQLSELLHSSLMLIMITLIMGIIIFFVIAYFKGYNFWSLIFGSVYDAEPSMDYETFASNQSKLAWRPLAPLKSSTPTIRSTAARNLSSMSTDISPLSSSSHSVSDRSNMLWSIPDASLSPADLRKRRWR